MHRVSAKKLGLLPDLTQPLCETLRKPFTSLCLSFPSVQQGFVLSHCVSSWLPEAQCPVAQAGTLRSALTMRRQHPHRAPTCSTAPLSADPETLQQYDWKGGASPTPPCGTAPPNVVPGRKTYQGRGRGGAPRLPILTGDGGAVACLVRHDELVLEAASSNPLGTDQHQGFPAEGGHACHLLVDQQLMPVKL